MKRVKRCTKWAAIVAMTAVLLLLVIDVVLAWRAGARLEHRLAALRAAGEPVSGAGPAGRPACAPDAEQVAVFNHLRRPQLRPQDWLF